MKNFLAIIFIMPLALLSGCSQPVQQAPLALTYQRGQQLLAAGSPKSAIPYLTQTIASAPDGPEPVAILALAYALDLQDERAIVQARQVRRTDGSAPGWELVAIGLAQMTQHRPAVAAASLEHATLNAAPNSPLAIAGRQWLTLAYIQAGDPNRAADSLRSLAKCPHMFSTALMWMTLLYSQQGMPTASLEALKQCARAGTNDSGERALKTDLSAADDQTLYDAGVAALANGDNSRAAKLFALVQEHNPKGSDAPVWLALIAGATQDWQSARRQLKEATNEGGLDCRGLANQLFSVICAIEDRPDDMIESTLAGQRLLGRNSQPAYIVEPPQPEPVWGADYMK